MRPATRIEAEGIRISSFFKQLDNQHAGREMVLHGPGAPVAKVWSVCLARRTSRRKGPALARYQVPLPPQRSGLPKSGDLGTRKQIATLPLPRVRLEGRILAADMAVGVRKYALQSSTYYGSKNPGKKSLKPPEVGPEAASAEFPGGLGTGRCPHFE